MSAASPSGPSGQDTTSLGDAAARGTGATLLTQAVRAVLQFASVVVIARLLTPEDFGLIAMVVAVIGVADLVRDFGLSTAAVQASTLSKAERTNLFWANLGLGVLCAVLSVAATPLIVAIFDEPRLAPIVLALSTVFVLSGANTQYRADLARSMRFGTLGASDVAAQSAGILVAVGAGLAEAGYWALVAQQLTVAVVSLTLNGYRAHWLPGLPQRSVSMVRFFRFGGGLLGTQSVGYVIKNVDNIALGAFTGAVQLGIYSRAYQLLMTPLNSINAPMTRVAVPVLSKVQHDDAAFARYLSRVQVVGCLVTATVFSVSAGVAEPLVAVLFGPRWTEVAPVFAVLAIGGVFRAVSQIAYWVYLARGVPGAQFRVSLVMAPVMIALILAGLPWGPVGVAAGHSVAYFVMWLVTLAHVGRAAGVASRPLFTQALRTLCLVSLPAGVAAWFGSAAPWPALAQLGSGLAAAAVAVGLMHLAVPSLRRDAVVLVGFARRAVGRART